MAKEKKSEGAAVRLAHSGPSIEHDPLIDFIEARNQEDKVRASSAGESRAKIGAFLAETEMNSQALSWCRSILKKADQAKAMDVIMSLKIALPMVEAHVRGQGTAEMNLEPENVISIKGKKSEAADAADGDFDSALADVAK